MLIVKGLWGGGDDGEVVIGDEVLHACDLAIGDWDEEVDGGVGEEVEMVPGMEVTGPEEGKVGVVFRVPCELEDLIIDEVDRGVGNSSERLELELVMGGEELDGIFSDAKDSDRCEGDGVDGFV